jgi:hypothetical protein
MRRVKAIFVSAALLAGFTHVVQLGAAESYADRFVWVFGWGLGNDGDSRASTFMTSLAKSVSSIPRSSTAARHRCAWRISPPTRTDMGA